MHVKPLRPPESLPKVICASGGPWVLGCNGLSARPLHMGLWSAGRVLFVAQLLLPLGLKPPCPHFLIPTRISVILGTMPGLCVQGPCSAAEP